MGIRAIKRKYEGFERKLGVRQNQILKILEKKPAKLTQLSHIMRLAPSDVMTSMVSLEERNKVYFDAGMWYSC